MNTTIFLILWLSHSLACLIGMLIASAAALNRREETAERKRNGDQE